MSSKVAVSYPQPVDKKPDLQFTTPPRRLISWAPIIILVVGILLVAGALGYKAINSNQKTSVDKLASGEQVLPAHTAQSKTIKVDVSGSVARPGVYEIPDDSRIQDVLITAGGLVPNADRKYISKTINLAKKLSDGEKIYLPFQGEAGTAVSNNGSDQNLSSNLVNINTSTAAELDGLPGVGPVTANKIISGRPYNETKDLVGRKIISNSEYLKIQSLIVSN